MPSQFLRRTFLPAALLVIALVLSRSASAATLTVTNLGDTGAPGQLRTLINVAAPGDTIVIPSGIITLTTFNFEDGNATGDLDIHKDLTIQGAGAALTIIAGGDRLFDIFDPAIVTISGVTVRNGGGFGEGGGGIRNAGTLTLINVTVSDNRSSSFQLLGLQNMTGGGILNNGTMTLTNCTISSNTANFGRGGGIANTGTMTLTNVILNANTANDVQGGGGGGIANTGTLTLTNGSISGNSASGGGGIFNGGTFASETSSGIDVTLVGGTLSLINVTISNNTGGGIFNLAGTATLSNVAIAGNTADFGGGTTNTVNGTMNLTNVTISGNTASGTFGLGGGISNAGTLTLSNVTVSGNSAESGGGGIATFAGNLTATNVTISNNTGGGILSVDGTSFGAGKSSAQLRNTIVANSPSAANCTGSPGIITSLGHNLDSGNTCGFTGPGDLSNTDPKLGPLQNNGGFTLTHALLVGSPAIDAGTNTSCPATDQRGFARPVDGDSNGIAICDIGAYEFGAIDPITAFVTRLYQTVLLRDPDAPGLAAHVADIQSFGTVIPTVLAFFHSEEFLSQPLTDDQFLDRLYHTFLNRAPDPAGLQAFQDLLASGCRTRDTLIAALTFSDEFKSLVPPLPVADLRVPFVAELYAWILNRPPDPAFQGWVNQLTESTALATVLSFLHSPEFQTPRRDTATYVNALYLAFLGRPPDCGGLTFWVTTLTQQGDTDAARDQVAGQFAASQEFQAKLNQLFP